MELTVFARVVRGVPWATRARARANERAFSSALLSVARRPVCGCRRRVHALFFRQRGERVCETRGVHSRRRSRREHSHGYTRVIGESRNAAAR